MDSQENNNDQQDKYPTTPPPVDASAAQYPPAPPPGFYGYAPQQANKKSFFSGFLFRIIGGALVSLILLIVTLGIYGAFISSAMQKAGMQETLVDGSSDATAKIVILPIEGMIDSSTTSYIKKSLKFIKSKATMPLAIILRIDSPGGGLTASDQIAEYLHAFKKEHDLPFVASYGRVCASGGVYISADSQKILAERTTMTGSIGVIAQAFTYHQLLEKIGITPETIVAEGSPNKDVLNGARPWTDKDRDLLRKFLDSGHSLFTEKIKKGRKDKMTEEQFASATSGDPFTAAEALELGLIDEIGYLEDAIEAAKQLAELDENTKVKVTRISESKSPLSQLLQANTDKPAINLNQVNGDTLRKWLIEMSVPNIEARIN